MVGCIAEIFTEIETHVRTNCWISRVSSFSNIADGPSRGDSQTVKGLGFKDVSDAAVNCLRSLFMSVVTKMGRAADKNVPR